MTTRMPATRLKAGVFVLAVLATAILVALSPEDETLGGFVRFLYFHGALTWVNLGTFTLAAIAAVWFLAKGGTAQYRWAGSFRYVSLALWIVNTWMGFESMRRTWGGIKWDEPRLAMSIWVLLAALVVFGLDLVLHDKRRITATLDVLLAAGVWYGTWTVMVVTAAEDFHPDSPVFNSGPEVIGFYLAMTAASLVWVVAGSAMLRDRLGRHDLERPGAGRASE